MLLWGVRGAARSDQGCMGAKHACGQHLHTRSRNETEAGNAKQELMQLRVYGHGGPERPGPLDAKCCWLWGLSGDLVFPRQDGLDGCVARGRLGHTRCWASRTSGRRCKGGDQCMCTSPALVCSGRTQLTHGISQRFKVELPPCSPTSVALLVSSAVDELMHGSATCIGLVFTLTHFSAP